MTKTKIYFDIYSEYDGEARGDLIIMVEKNKYTRYPALSGPHGKGSIEKGEYDVVSCYQLDKVTKNNPYKRDAFPWMAGLKPLFETERNNLAIHPEGNIHGTLGCIGILKNDLYAHADIHSLLRIEKIIRMKVI